ncbi:MAG: SpoIIE family protein phosphatase [Candidatus Kapabacteria bacterium]|nr:SpoIIE family protein phosphatase [Ignavibacteriota bacterium]MCW5886447.1 SpoIIE family protein phosphatase [Candidatus Kapabacteria bacterium]
MRNLILLSALFFVMINISNAQLSGQARIDSLLKELPKMKEDTNGVYLVYQLADYYFYNDDDKFIEYSNIGYEISNKINWQKGIAFGYEYKADELISKLKFLEASEYYNKSIEIFSKSNDKTQLMRLYKICAAAYHNALDYDSSINYYLKGLDIAKDKKDSVHISIYMNDIGTLYNDLGDVETSLTYFFEALDIDKKKNRLKEQIVAFINIGMAYQSIQKLDSAKIHYYLAFETDINLNGKVTNFRTYRLLGVMYTDLLEYDSAYKYLDLSYKSEKENNNIFGFAESNSALAYYYFYMSNDTNLAKRYPNKIKNYQLQTINYGKNALEIYGEFDDIYSSYGIYKMLFETFLKQRDYKSALDYHILYNTISDSIKTNETILKLANSELKHQKKQDEEQIEILNERTGAQKFQILLISVSCVFLLAAFAVAFIRFREKKKLSDVLQIQKNLIEEKNEQIVASITYASTIQNAILPWKSTLKLNFGDILVFYKPKDIVSGDSYWFQEIDGIKFLAVIDCTGHGIPGAMLTVIAATALDDAVLGKRLSDTGQILTYMNDKVTEVLNQKLEENKIRDGMEVCMLAIHQNKIQFSGAGRPLYLKNGTLEIIKTDKRGIAGQTENDEYTFSSVEIERTENMMLYLTSDGYSDQMNENSKKYSTKRFVALLDSISDKPINEQHETLENEFNSHKGGRSQIDDVTIIGVKI